MKNCNIKIPKPKPEDFGLLIKHVKKIPVYVKCENEDLTEEKELIIKLLSLDLKKEGDRNYVRVPLDDHDMASMNYITSFTGINRYAILLRIALRFLFLRLGITTDNNESDNEDEFEWKFTVFDDGVADSWKNHNKKRKKKKGHSILLIYDNGERKRYKSIRAASRENDIKYHQLRDLLNGKGNKSQNYRFRAEYLR